MATRVKKEVGGNGHQDELRPVPTAKFEHTYPSLSWHLSSSTWGDGRGERLPGALSIFHQDGMVKVALRERNMGQVVFFAGATVGDALQTLETALARHAVRWREDKYARKE